MPSSSLSPARIRRANRFPIRFSCELTLNCVTKSQTFKYKAKRTGSDYHVQALFSGPVDITKHNVEVPCYLGVCVEKDVKVKAKFKLRDGK